MWCSKGNPDPVRLTGSNGITESYKPPVLYAMAGVYNEKNSCSDCNAELVIDSKFCRMCGKFPL